MGRPPKPCQLCGASREAPHNRKHGRLNGRQGVPLCGSCKGARVAGLHRHGAATNKGAIKLDQFGRASNWHYYGWRDFRRLFFSGHTTRDPNHGQDTGADYHP